MAKNEYLCTLEPAEPLIGRVVYRGNNNANANGGVSNANANNAPSNTNANVGSRLNYKQTRIIGVQQWERVPSVVPREGSHSNSSYCSSDEIATYRTGKLKNHVDG